ncbi:MAG TPA: heterodisulfide reductase-related iron-sulfur binding cluster, partial [Tepidisphaeraceae bacterium]|nr:heterodisulfide reductase-related iron-sulfur binding cluster [Tepidisphaeraceae bacterium]
MSASPHNPAMQLDPRTYARGRSCVHCGLCLPACPTYTQTFNEADSPRGRIQLMLALSDGAIQPTESVRKHLDLCLDCRGCETACPSGVVYHELIEETREKLTANQIPTFQDRLMRWTFFHILAKPRRLKLAMVPGRIAKALGLFKFLPASLAKLGQMIPSGGSWWPRSLPRIASGGVSPREVVGFFPTCVGSVMYDQVNRKSVELLQAAGVTVSTPNTQVCCGAIHLHNGDQETAMNLARQNIRAFTSGEPVG